MPSHGVKYIKLPSHLDSENPTLLENWIDDFLEVFSTGHNCLVEFYSIEGIRGSVQPILFISFEYLGRSKNV